MKRSLSLVALVAVASCSAAPSGGPNAIPGPADAAARPARVAHAGNTEFTTSGRNILLDGKPFFVKGVDYAPVPICSVYQETPLANSNAAIWQRDLPNIRKLGANAIRVYNSNADTPIDQFLTAAYNGGTNPIYTVLSIRIDNPDLLLNQGAVDALYGQYYNLAKNNGANPDVLGISIFQEIDTPARVNNPAWWKGLKRVAQGAIDGFKAIGAKKIVTSTFTDNDSLDTVRKAVANGYNIDVYGATIYRGPNWGQGNLWPDVERSSTKPFLIMEWGASEGYHPGGVPNQIEEYPADKASIMSGYLDELATSMYPNSTLRGGPVSGGFIFEWSDEWYKAGVPESDGGCKHVANGTVNGAFPDGYNDEAWYGLNIISAGTPNVLAERPAFGVLQETWAKQPDH